MQEYNELVTTDACNTYLEKADKNIQSVASTFSGTAFPTTNLAVGMQCMRTDDSNNIYKLTSVSPVTWELVPSKSYVDNAVTTGVESITNFKGATSTAAGAAGLVPAPDKGTQTDYYLSAVSGKPRRPTTPIPYGLVRHGSRWTQGVYWYQLAVIPKAVRRILITSAIQVGKRNTNSLPMS